MNFLRLIIIFALLDGIINFVKLFNLRTECKMQDKVKYILVLKIS